MNTQTHRNVGLSLLMAGLGCGHASAGTIAHWSFEGPVDANVASGGDADGTYSDDILDQSGNGNHLGVWSEGGGAGFAYRADTPNTAGNGTSIQNTGGSPAAWNESLAAWNPSTFTFEAFIKPEETDGFRTIIGRDSQGGSSGDANLAAMYFQITNTDVLAFKFLDNDGNWHEALGDFDPIAGWDFATGSPDDIDWIHIAATSDGSNLNLYINHQQVAFASLGGGDTALSTGTGTGSDWTAGHFSVARGLYGGGHGDRAWGLIDEIRISDEALTPDQFLQLVPEPGTLSLSVLAMAGFLRRRRN
ncbi:MAG: LamG-like jellyroll fold domain-containing protein [Verrucomicrobiales bacterium]